MSVVSPFGLLLTAWERLNPGNGAARSEIASLLGLTAAPVTATEQRPREKVLEPSPVGLENEQESRPHEDRKPTRSEVVANWIPAEEDANDTPLLGSESLDLSRPLQPLPPKPLLLNPKWVRGIFSSQLSTTVASRELDIAACLRHEVKNLPYRRVPFRPVQTMSAGVRCYVDAGAPFEMLFEDRRQVIQGLRSLAGFERVTVRSFETVPDAMDIPVRDAPELAAENSPVLLITDFGHYSVPGRRWASLDAWEEYIERERSRGTTRVVALTPLDSADWPAALRARIEFLAWDWQTAARTARRRDT
jgi:hypothetical protein